MGTQARHFCNLAFPGLEECFLEKHIPRPERYFFHGNASEFGQDIGLARITAGPLQNCLTANYCNCYLLRVSCASDRCHRQANVFHAGALVFPAVRKLWIERRNNAGPTVAVYKSTLLHVTQLLEYYVAV